MENYTPDVQTGRIVYLDEETIASHTPRQLMKYFNEGFMPFYHFVDVNSETDPDTVAHSFKPMQYSISGDTYYVSDLNDTVAYRAVGEDSLFESAIA